MLIREIVAGVGSTDARVVVDPQSIIEVDLGVRRTTVPLGDLVSADVLVRRVLDPRDVDSYWPHDVPDGMHVVTVIERGTREMPMSQVLNAAARHKLAIIDAIGVSDLGVSSLAVIARRTDAPIPPRGWLTDVLDREEGGASARVQRAVGSYVLRRSVEDQRVGVRLAELGQVERERDELRERLEVIDSAVPNQPAQLLQQIRGRPIDIRQVLVEHSEMRRRLDAIHRSRTWRVGRIFWAIWHPARVVASLRSGERGERQTWASGRTAPQAGPYKRP